MVFTGAQTLAFFEDANQMGLANRIRVFLQSEGITDVDNLEEFNTKDSWIQVLMRTQCLPQHLCLTEIMCVILMTAAWPVSMAT